MSEWKEFLKTTKRIKGISLVVVEAVSEALDIEPKTIRQLIEYIGDFINRRNLQAKTDSRRMISQRNVPEHGRLSYYLKQHPDYETVPGYNVHKPQLWRKINGT